jgi:hypothetical protein
MPLWVAAVTGDIKQTTAQSGAPSAAEATATGAAQQRFRATPEAEARLLLLIDGFSRKGGGVPRSLEGRVKLAKLDFLLRYPRQLQRVLAARPVKNRDQVLTNLAEASTDDAPFDARMVRYRYGPWDPAYYALLGALIGRQLVEMLPLPGGTGFGYRTSARGAELAAVLRADESFAPIVARTALLRRHLDLNGATLKRLLYDLSDVAEASWHEELQ